MSEAYFLIKFRTQLEYSDKTSVFFHKVKDNENGITYLKTKFNQLSFTA